MDSSTQTQARCQCCGSDRPKGRDVTCPRRFALQGSECRECASVLYAIGSHFACRDNTCSRYGTLVDHMGYTEDESDRESERNFEGTLAQ